MTEQKKMTTLQADEVRKIVEGHYAHAVTAATAPRTCCGPAPAPVQIETLTQAHVPAYLDVLERGRPGALAEQAGYTPDQLATLPEDAVKASFGCGNPVNLAGLRPGDTVVDLGSGAGIDVILAARRVGETGRVIGIDMTDDMIAHAHENIARAGLTNVEIRKGLIEELPVESGTVDWILSNCVINLSPEKPRVFAEAFRVLKPGGQFLVSDIVVGDIPDAIRENVLGYVSCVGGAVAEHEYPGIIRDAGFVDLSIPARHVYSARELLSFAGYDDWPEGEMGDMARQIVGQLEGQIVSIKVHARKPA